MKTKLADWMLFFRRNVLSVGTQTLCRNLAVCLYLIFAEINLPILIYDRSMTMKYPQYIIFITACALVLLSYIHISGKGIQILYFFIFPQYTY